MEQRTEQRPSRAGADGATGAFPWGPERLQRSPQAAVMRQPDFAEWSMG